MKIDINYSLKICLEQNDKVFYPVIKVIYEDYTQDFEITKITNYDNNTSEPLFDELNISGLNDLNDLHSYYNNVVSIDDIKKYLPNSLCENIEDIIDIISSWSVDSSVCPEVAIDMFKDYIDDFSNVLDRLNINYERYEYAQ